MNRFNVYCLQELFAYRIGLLRYIILFINQATYRAIQIYHQKNIDLIMITIPSNG